MKRPILLILIFSIFGIQIAHNINNFYLQMLFIFGSFILSHFIYRHYYNSKPNNFMKYIIKYIILFTLVFFVYTLNIKHKEDTDITNIIESNIDVEVFGVIKSIDISSSNRHKLLINIDKLYLDGLEVTKNLDIYTYAPLTKNLKIGDYVSVTGSLALPEINKNPNAYNENLVYKTKGIDYKMFGNKVQILKSDSFLSKINNAHQSIFDIYDEVLPEIESSILKAMILGEKQFLDDDIKSTYQEAGIYHILAISGLHIGILCMFLTRLFEKLPHGKLFVILILICYCAFTGGSISTVRACIMCIVVLVSNIIYRNSDFICSICFSAILVLLINPYYLFDIGFIYSYTAVFTIALIVSRIDLFYKMNKFIIPFVTSFFVCIALKPITAYYFYYFQPYDIFLNIIILPFMSLLILAGFSTTFLGLINIKLAEFCVGTVYYILKFFTALSNLVNDLPFSNVIVGKPNFLFIVSFYLMLFVVAYAFYDRHLFYKRKKFINVGILIFGLCSLFNVIRPQTLNLTILDVGQGDGIVCEYGNLTFLVDGGGERYYAVGDNIVLPYLHSKGISNLDFVFVSHIDTDHINGIIEIADDIEIQKIFLPKTTSKEGKFLELMEVAEQNEIDVYYVEIGDSILISDDFYIDILHPSTDFTRSSNNENSIVFKMIYYETSILFTGDVEEYGEKFILSNEIDLSADILKVGHHGSKTSSTRDFLEAVNPSIALISCKENNIYNHPSPIVLENLEDMGISVYRTDIDDAITLNISKKGNIYVKTIK